MYLALGLSIAAIVLALCAIAAVSIYSQQITQGSNYDRNPSSHQNNANARAMPEGGNENTYARQNTKNNKKRPVGPIWQWLNEREGAVTALSTVFLTLFTFALFGATIGLYLTGEKSAQAAKDSAHAAQQSADAIANVERPYIFVVPKPSKIAAKDGPAELTPTIAYSVSNFGRVPAIFRLVYAQCFAAQQLSPTPTYSKSKFKNSQSAIGAGATSTNFPECELKASLTDSDWADIIADKKGVIFTAIFLYEGALDYTYVTAVTYKIDMFTGNAYPIGGAAYNYDQSERGRITYGAPIPLPNIVP